MPLDTSQVCLCGDTPSLAGPLNITLAAMIVVLPGLPVALAPQGDPRFFMGDNIVEYRLLLPEEIRIVGLYTLTQECHGSLESTTGSFTYTMVSVVLRITVTTGLEDGADVPRVTITNITALPASDSCECVMSSYEDFTAEILAGVLKPTMATIVNGPLVVNGPLFMTPIARALGAQVPSPAGAPGTSSSGAAGTGSH
jgi:hypothetical protein